MANGFEVLLIELDALAFAVHLFPAIFAVTCVERIEPVEEWGAIHTVELHKVALKVHINHCTLDATEEILLKHFLRLFGVTHKRHILLVHSVEITTLDPATLKTALFQHGLDCLVGIHNQTFRIRDAIAQQNARHALTGAVFDAEARIDNDFASVFRLLQILNRLLLAAHVENHILLHALIVELFFTINVDQTTALAQLLGSCVKNGCVVTYVIRGIRTSTHNCSYFNFSHNR